MKRKTEFYLDRNGWIRERLIRKPKRRNTRHVGGKMKKVQWSGHGWKRQPIGRLKLGSNAPFYRGRWVDLIETNERGAVVFIHPAERDIRSDEIEKIELNAEAEEAAVLSDEASLDYFNRYIAGDR